MDLNKHKFHGNFKLSGYEPGKITVNHETYTTSIIISEDKLITNWEPQTINSLSKSHLDIVLALKPEMIILGTGKTHLFIEEDLLVNAFKLDIAVEVMSTHKACMLFPLMLNEQKKVAAALMP